MQRTITASSRFAAPWWVAAALFEIHGDATVTPALEELHARVTRFTNVTRRARVESGPVERAAGIVTMPLHWRDASHAGAFPEMHAEVRVVAIDEHTTEVQLAGRYEPPFGALGAVVDTIIGRRLAQRTADETVDRLAAHIQTAVDDHLDGARCAGHTNGLAPIDAGSRR
jgi:hypothetical protein